MKLRSISLNIVGIIVISIGSYLTYLGTTLDNNKSQAQLNSKLDAFNKKLDNVQSSNLTPAEKQKKIETIKSEFDNWAEDLKDNYSKIDLSNQKKVISKSEKRLADRKRWNILLNTAFNNLFKMAHSISKKTTSDTLDLYFNSKNIPEDFFTNQGKNYYLIIKFKKNYCLGINPIEILSSTSGNDDVSLKIKQYDNVLNAKRQSSNPDNSLIISFLGNNFFISKYGNFINFIPNKEKEFYPLSDLTTILQEIMANQYILSNK